MEVRCQLTGKQAISKQVKQKIMGVTMATSHGSPPPVTLNSNKNNNAYLDTRAH